jgi:hypothetical protein
MAWTAPVTWTPNSTLTAALLNTHLRDNMLETFAAKATTDNMFPVVSAAGSIAARSCFTDTIATSQGTTSTSFTNLATVGPTISITTAGIVWLFWAASASNSQAATGSRMGIDVSGATTFGAADSYALQIQDQAVGGGGHFAMSMTLEALNAGTNTFTAKYRSNSAGGTATFQFRELVVMAF